MKKTFILVLSVSTLFLAACTSVKNTSESDTPVPTATVAPTATPTFTPAPTATPTFTPIPTAIPSEVPEYTYADFKAKWEANQFPLREEINCNLTTSSNQNELSLGTEMTFNTIIRVNGPLTFTHVTLSLWGYTIIDDEDYTDLSDLSSPRVYSQDESGSWRYVAYEFDEDTAEAINSQANSLLSGVETGTVEATETGYSITVDATQMLESIYALTDLENIDSKMFLTFNTDKELNILNGFGKCIFSMITEESSVDMAMDISVLPDEEPVVLPEAAKNAVELQR